MDIYLLPTYYIPTYCLPHKYVCMHAKTRRWAQKVLDDPADDDPCFDHGPLMCAS